MKFYSEEQINKILEDSNTITHFKTGLAKLEDTECGIIETVKVEDGDSIIIQYPEAFADVTMESVAANILQTMLGEDFYEEMEAGGLYYGKLTLGQ